MQNVNYGLPTPEPLYKVYISIFLTIQVQIFQFFTKLLTKKDNLFRYGNYLLIFISKLKCITPFTLQQVRHSKKLDKLIK